MQDSFIKINKETLKDNIYNIKSNYNYKYYILDITNNAFNHGIEIINHLNDIDYLYTTIFRDVLKVRKYNSNVPIIYNGELNDDNIYDLILNNAILAIKDIETIEYILKKDIKDKFEIILHIDVEGFNGINSKHIVNDIKDILSDYININILGVMAQVNEKNYNEFKYIISPLKNLDLVILNNEFDKNKIKMSNAILLNNSIYGINTNKKVFFKQNNNDYRQVFTLYSKIGRIIRKLNKQKEIFYAIIPLGYLNGLNKSIAEVYIKDKLYKIKEIKENYTIITVDKTIQINTMAEITGVNNPITNYINDNPLLYFNNFNYLKVLYEDTIEDIYE